MSYNIDTPIEDHEPDLVLTDRSDPIWNICERFVDFTEEKRELNRKLKSADAQLDRLAPVLLEYFQTNRIRHLKLETPHGGRGTIWLREELWARPKNAGDRIRVCEALRQVGLGHFVEADFNTLTL